MTEDVTNQENHQPKGVGGMYQQFTTSEQLETNGVVVDYGDFRVTIGRAGGANKRYMRALEVKTKPLRRAIQTETLPEDRGLEILQEVYASSIILNWETKTGTDEDTGQAIWTVGIEPPPGSPAHSSIGLWPVNETNLIATFKNLPDLFVDLQEMAQKVALFREMILENDAGN